MEMTKKSGLKISRFTVFAVAQFALYMGMFALYYWHNQTEMSNSAWRMWLIAAVVVGLLASLVPKIRKEENVPIPKALNVILPVVVYLLFITGYCFYTWSVPDADYFLITFANFYLFGTAVLTLSLGLVELNFAQCRPVNYED